MSYSQDELPYLQHIAHRPNDLSRYEDYASYLEGKGETRAESIRTAVDQARAAPWETARLEIASKAWEKHRDAWLEPLAQTGITKPFFGHGIPDGVGMEPKEFMEKGAAALSIYPQLAIHLFPTHTHEELESLRTCEHLDLVSSLKIQGTRQAGEMLEALTQNPEFKNIRHLTLDNNQLNDATVAVLLESPNKGNIETLDLRSNQLTDRTLQAIANAPGSESLRELNLLGNPIGDEGLKAIATTGYLSNLEKLNLIKNKATDAGIRALGSTRGLSHLKEIHLTDKAQAKIFEYALREARVAYNDGVLKDTLTYNDPPLPALEKINGMSIAHLGIPRISTGAYTAANANKPSFLNRAT